MNRLCPVGWQSCEYDQNQVDADPSIENTCITPQELNEFASCQQGCAETGIRYGGKQEFIRKDRRKELLY